MANHPLLSLCMIAKDGGASLSRCLESVRGVADETIVVDTGSCDDTVARAAAAGAKVLHHPWDDDFAAARNVGLEAAAGEWILLLDCDEYFEPPQPAGLRDALRRPQYLGYFLPIESALADGEQLDSTVLRLWRHSRTVRFRFPIHEQVLPDLEPIAARTQQRFAVLTDLRIVHDGYTSAAIAAHGKVERNLRLFQKTVALHPDEPYLWYKFAEFLRGQANRKVEALAAAERALALVEARDDRRTGKGAPYWSELLTILGALLLEVGRRQEVLALVAAHPPESLGSPSFAYVAALACEAEGQLDAALHHLESCCGATRPVQLTTWRPNLVGPQGESLRARLLLAKGDPRGAIAAAERALTARPGYTAAVELKSEALIAAGAAGDALRFLVSEVKRSPHEKRLWRQVGGLLTRLGRPLEASRCLARA